MKTINFLTQKTHSANFCVTWSRTTKKIVIKRHNRSIARLDPTVLIMARKASALTLLRGFTTSGTAAHRFNAGQELVGEGRKR